MPSGSTTTGSSPACCPPASAEAEVSSCPSRLGQGIGAVIGDIQGIGEGFPDSYAIGAVGDGEGEVHRQVGSGAGNHGGSVGVRLIVTLVNLSDVPVRVNLSRA